MQLAPDDPMVAWLRDLIGAPRLEEAGIVKPKTKPKIPPRETGEEPPEGDE